MSSISSNNKRIAKNTLFLYIRMLLMMAVSFFTTREVLRILGAEDFGIYNLVGGFVILFTFINNSMTLATQRFLNFEIGKGDEITVRRVFSSSVSIHFILACVIALFAESIGLWFLNNYLNIPEEKMNAANIVYQFSLLGMLINIIRTPYNAAIIAYEKMDFFSYLSVAEAVLKLMIVYILLIFRESALVAYSGLNCIVILLITMCYYIFCRKSFSTCKYFFFFDKDLYKKLLSFSGWSLFGSFGNVCAQQGTSILLNMFYGVTVNAAVGVASQVNSAVYTFVTNFQTAFNPQIVKNYASEKFEEFYNLIIRSSKFSFFLLWLISLPVLICCNELLGLWLNEVPEYSTIFSRLIIVFSLIDAIQGPLWISVQATGKIKNYQIIMSLLILLNIPISYVLLRLGFRPELVFLVRILINIITSIYRVLYLKKHMGFSVRNYLTLVCVPCIIIVLVSLPMPIITYNHVKGLWGIILTIVVSIICCSVLIYFIGLTKGERNQIINIIKSKLIHK